MDEMEYLKNDYVNILSKYIFTNYFDGNLLDSDAKSVTDSLKDDISEDIIRHPNEVIKAITKAKYKFIDHKSLFNDKFDDAIEELDNFYGYVYSEEYLGDSEIKDEAMEKINEILEKYR